jgi:hypothetical protein
MKIKCGSIQKQLSDYLDGGLSAQKERLLEDHLSNCQRCLREFESLKAVSKLLTLYNQDSQDNQDNQDNQSQLHLAEEDELEFSKNLQSRLEEVESMRSNPISWSVDLYRKIVSQLNISAAYEAFVQSPILYINRILKNMVLITAVVVTSVFLDRTYIRPMPDNAGSAPNQIGQTARMSQPQSFMSPRSNGSNDSNDGYTLRSLRPVDISYQPRSLAQVIRLVYVYASGERSKPIKAFNEQESEFSPVLKNLKTLKREPFDEVHTTSVESMGSVGDVELSQFLQITQVSNSNQSSVNPEILRPQDGFPSRRNNDVTKGRTMNKSGLSSIISTNVDLPLPSIRDMAEEKVN